MYPRFVIWGWFWRPFDVISIVLLDIVAKITLRLQSQRDSKTAATVGATRVPPEKPRPRKRLHLPTIETVINLNNGGFKLNSTIECER